MPNLDALESVSTYDLIDRVVNRAMEKALYYLLENRKLFYYQTKSLRLSDFVWKLRERTIKMRDSKKTVIEEVDDAAYDLTIKKFANLPLNKADMINNENSLKKLKQKQVDCRNYYRVVLSSVEKWKENNPSTSELEEERIVGIILQRLVIKHYFLSRLEFLRKKRPFSVRYIHRVGKKSISLWYPAGLRAEAIREWIKGNISKSGTDISEEQSRLQAELDKLFYQGTPSSDECADPKSNQNIHSKMSESIHSFIPSALARAVVFEKINHINDLRPAIKKLGEKTLSQLIFRIFGDLKDDRFRDGDIANDFELSKATFSRFAGSKWKDNHEEGNVIVPDLWQNTAKVIASDPDFCESAQTAGVLVKVKKILT